MPVFDVDNARVDLDAIRIGEPTLAYFNRSAMPKARSARRIINSLFAAFPKSHQQDILNRMMAGHQQFEAALFELVMYSAMIHCGFDVRLVDPASPGSNPDLLLYRNGDHYAIVEATVMQESDELVKEERRLYEFFLKATELLNKPRYWIIVCDYRTGEGNPSPSTFSTFVQTAFEASNTQRKERYTYVDGNWSIQFRFQRPSDPTKVVRNICGLISSPAYAVDCKNRVKDAIRKKLRQHRGSRLPMILAVATNNFVSLPDDEDMQNVLLGSAVQGGGSDGIWSDPNSRASGILLGLVHFPHCYPSGLDELRCTLWDNPWLATDSRVNPWCFHRRIWNGQEKNCNFIPGDHLAPSLGLDVLAREEGTPLSS